MGKDINFTGQPVLTQLLKLMDKSKICNIAQKMHTNRYTKHLDGYSHLVVMLYAVICHLRSLREVVLAFESHPSRMNHFGLSHMVYRSTLSDANKRRPSEFFGAIYRSLYQRYAPLLSDSLTKRELNSKLYVMDSTTITLFSQILKGSGRNSKNSKKKGGIKAHTIIEEDTALPVMVDFTAAAVSDHDLMEQLFKLPQGSFLAFDMGYLDYYVWKRLTDAGYRFVTRLKSNANFRIIQQNKCPDEHVIGDQIIEFSYNKKVERPMTTEELSHRRGRRPKSGVVMVTEHKKGTFRCRRVLRRTDDGKGLVEFVTNVMTANEMTAEQVCETYRRRWTIEKLFRRLKQNFPLKYFLGDNVNAIEIQIWVTMIAYLLLRVIQHKSMTKLSFSNVVTTTKLTITSYINIVTLLNSPKRAWKELERQNSVRESPPCAIEQDLFASTGGVGF